MELAISAVAGELVSRFVSFLTDRYLHSSRPAQSEEKQLKKLQQLLLSAHTVVEEADGRYITNSGMLAQLSVLTEAMYQGYWALGAFRYMSLEEPMEEEGVVRNPSPPKRFRMVHGSARKNKAMYLLELQGSLESLEDVVAGMMEFVVLLGGCDRMLRRPYDTYLYSDNIMFGRHAEKQKLLNFMLQHGPPGGVPAVLPIIGGPVVGKRTLVAHVCKDERVRSHFSWILHLNGDSFCTLADHDRSLLPGKILVVVELVSDVNEEDWAKFRSAVATSMDSGSKVIITSRLRNSERLGTVKPVFLNTLSYGEFSYLFKTLAFGSADPVQHPRLARIADEFARELRSEWSLVATNILADVMRRNLSVHFWLCVLSRLRRLVERNFSMFGEHPKDLLQRRHQVDVTDIVLHPAAPPLRIVPSCARGSSSSTEVAAEREALPRVRLGDLVIDPGVRPQGDFNVVSWESRMPPYTSFVYFVPNGDGAPGVVEQSTPLSGRKRPALPL